MVDSLERCFANPYISRSGDSGFLNADGSLKESFRAKLEAALKDGLQLVDAAHANQGSDHTIYTGATGIALLHLHIALSLGHEGKKSGAAFDRKLHLQRAAELLYPTLSQLPRREATFLCGAAGPLAVGAAVFHYLESPKDSQHCIKHLNDLAPNVLGDHSLPSELLYGRVGYLYALLFVKKHCPRAIKEELLVQVVRSTLDAGKAGHRPHIPSPLMYEWHGTQYLGAAHGLAGILTVLLQVDSETCSQEVRELAKPCIQFLLTQQFPSGNFKSSYGNDRDRLVHWCHGAPGIVTLLIRACKVLEASHLTCMECSTSKTVYGEKTFQQPLQKAVELTWERGLLRKGFGLCHGVAGNAYPFLQMYSSTREVKYLHRACRFAEWCLSADQHPCRQADRPYSLFEGLAGTLYFYVDLLANVENACFPALEA